MTITVLGYDGSPLPALARGALAGASLVVGGRRHLDAVPVPASARTVVMGDVGDAVAALAAHDGPAVVVASGDPGFFGIVRRLRAAGLSFEVIPAVSAVAAAFARAGVEWDDAVVLSGHGRDPRHSKNALRACRRAAVLTGPDFGPAEVAAAVRDLDRRLVVAECLGEPDETVTALDPADAAKRDWRDPNVVLVLDDAPPAPAGWLVGAPPTPNRWALDEDAFAHRDSMITKAEVRAVALAHLGPRLGDLVWDVGSGSGSVAVECARFGAAVIAVERSADGAARIAENARTNEVDVLVVHGEAPAALAELPDPDAVFVGGGGPEVVAECARRALRSVVVTLAAVDRVPATRRALADAGLATGGVLLQASRLVPLPGDSTRLAATNPVFVLWGERQ
jgi:precorrin-6Y C5,15-methyltransferase (decarboxylating)